MNLNFLRRQAIISSQARKKNLPYLCELEYLESTGEQYITIPYQIFATDTFRHETANQYTQFGKQQYEGQTSAGNWYGINESGNYTIGGGINSTFTASTTDFDNIVAERNDTGLTLTVNGNIVGTRNSKSSGQKVYLFDCYNPNVTATGNYYNFVRKKYHRLYVNGSLFFDGIPVLDYNMKPAMFDRVSGKFFYNEGTGADFKYGLKDNEVNLYTSVPYIESTGGAMIRVDIPVTGTQKVKHVCCQQYVTQEGRQLEGFAQAGRWFGTNGGYYHITSSRKSDVMSSTTDFDKIVFESEVGRQSLIVNGAEILTMQTADIQDISGIRLFAAGGSSYVCYLKKKYHLFYLDNKLVFAGVPVVNTSGVAGLFDVITKTMFRNVFTGQFIAGE